MEAAADISGAEAALVEVEAGRADLETLVGAVDAALRSSLPALTVSVSLPPGDARAAALRALCGADPRVRLGPAEGDHPIVVSMPAAARPQPRTLPEVVAVLRGGGLAEVVLPLPGRFALLRRGALRARAPGSGSRSLRPGEVGLRSVASRGKPGPPPQGTLAQERAEHLRHRARSATMRARMDRNAQRLYRERLQTRHERARVRVAEHRLAATSRAQWLRLRARAAGRRAAALPAAAASGARSARVFARRARRYAVDRRRSRKLDAAS